MYCLLHWLCSSHAVFTVIRKLSERYYYSSPEESTKFNTVHLQSVSQQDSGAVIIISLFIPSQFPLYLYNIVDTFNRRFSWWSRSMRSLKKICFATATLYSLNFLLLVFREKGRVIVRLQHLNRVRIIIGRTSRPIIIYALLTLLPACSIMPSTTTSFLIVIQ